MRVVSGAHASTLVADIAGSVPLSPARGKACFRETSHSRDRPRCG